MIWSHKNATEQNIYFTKDEDWGSLPVIKKTVFVFPNRYQDVHNQAFMMVMASGRWLGVRLDLLASLLIGAVALAAVLVSQDAGKPIKVDP